jgi:hypothetical protein
VAIFEKIWSWWEAEGASILTEREMPFIRGQIEERFFLILKIIGYVALPHKDRINNFEGRLRSLMDAIDSAGLPTLFILPLLLLISGKTPEYVPGQLRQGLVSTQEDTVRAALDGVHEWLISQLSLNLPPLPFDVLGEVGSLIAARRSPGLFHALHLATSVARVKPELVTGRFADALQVGLEYLFGETPYERYTQQPRQHTIDYFAVPRFREAAVALAVSLRNVADLKNTEIVTRWISAARTDPLPEIRRLVASENRR